MGRTRPGRSTRRSGGSGRGSRTRSAPRVGTQDEDPAAGRYGLGPVVNEALAVDRHQVLAGELAGVRDQARQLRALGDDRTQQLPHRRPPRADLRPAGSETGHAQELDGHRRGGHGYNPLPSPYAPEPVVSKGAILLVVGDAAEVLDTFYPLFRLREEGYRVDVAGPERRAYHLVQHDRHPDWDI